MSSGPVQILLIDGTPDALMDIVAPLTGRGYRVTHRKDARGGLEEIYRKAPELLLIRRELPDMDGLHFCVELKNDLILRHIPVILLDADGLLESEIFAGESGAEDYLSGPLDMDELDGRIRQVFQMGTLGINYHPVTGLPSYNTVYRKIDEVLERKGPFAVCFMDIHSFRRYNQRFGYEKGDRILGATARLVSRVLQSRQRYLDFFGHLCSDDFVLITEADGVEDLCSDLVERFEWKMSDLCGSPGPDPDSQNLFQNIPNTQESLLEDRVFLSIAILTHKEGRPGHVAQMIEQGTDLLEHVKKERKSRWVRQKKDAETSGFQFQPGPVVLEETTGLLSGRFQKRPNGKLAQPVKQFHEIIRNHDIDMFFQPIVYLDSGDLFGYEALLRGPAGTHFESPVLLFGMARRLDMEADLDLLCLKELQAASRGIPETEKIFFNVSPESFFSPRFREAWESATEDLHPERMVLEVTRKRRIREFPGFRSAIEHFRKKGFQVAVDDAKAGTLSLRTILELLPDYIKIDISITRNIHENLSRQRIFHQFLSFCKRRKVKLISEGVERQQERDFLLENGAELAQGFYYSAPRRMTATSVTSNR